MSFRMFSYFCQLKKWARFAEGYNGTGYKENAYDTKMQKAYDVLKANSNKMP